MAGKIDVMVCGTGSFAARIVFDLAATASRPVTVAIAGRNTDRLTWLKVAANARAVLFGRPAEFVIRSVDLLAHGEAARLIAEDRPAVVVQAASSQPSSVISTHGDAWSQLVAEGGLSATAVFQALLSTRVARAIRDEHPGCHFINCCFPDVVNALIAAAGLPVACGVGNIAILSNAFAGAVGIRTPGALRMLAHYQTVGPWRRAPETRQGPVPRVWLAETEVPDVFARFAAVRITPEPAIEISGASAVPLILAMAADGSEWRGHVPGPLGLPGGYAVTYREGVLDLDLPGSIGRAEAVAWNAGFEEKNGLVVTDGKVHYTGPLHDRLGEASPQLARGFAVSELESVYESMVELRARLQALPAR
jgi:hypothetical protein